MKILRLISLLCFVFACSMWAKVPVKGNSTYGINEQLEGTQPFDGGSINEETFCATTPDPCPNNNMYIFEYEITKSLTDITLTTTDPVDTSQGVGFGVYQCTDHDPSHNPPRCTVGFDSDFVTVGTETDFTGGNFFTGGDLTKAGATVTFEFDKDLLTSAFDKDPDNVLVLFLAEDSSVFPAPPSLTPVPCVDCVTVSPVPEPSSVVLLTSASLVAIWLGRQRLRTRN